jgi:hypothetical protein
MGWETLYRRFQGELIPDTYVPSDEEKEKKDRDEKKGKLDLVEILYEWAEADEDLAQLKERILA